MIKRLANFDDNFSKIFNVSSWISLNIVMIRYDKNNKEIL